MAAPRAMAREKAPEDLAVLVGIGKPRPGKPGMGPGKDSPFGKMGMEEPEEDESGLDPDFEEAAAKAFPDMGPDQLLALQRAIQAAARAG